MPNHLVMSLWTSCISTSFYNSFRSGLERSFRIPKTQNNINANTKTVPETKLRTNANQKLIINSTTPTPVSCSWQPFILYMLPPRATLPNSTQI